MKDNKYVVLYVDDDQDMLDSVRFILEKKDYIMEEATTAEKGVVRYKECNPDLVIVDLMMEEVDSGINCVKELKLLGNKAPIYMLSSVGDNLNNTINFSDLGLTGVFQKPVEPEMLLKTLKAKLG
jgi:DNA-binding response OmpR family regulator